MESMKNGNNKTNQVKTHTYPTHPSHTGGTLTIFVPRFFEVIGDKLFTPFGRSIRASFPLAMGGGLKRAQTEMMAFSKIIATGCKMKNFNAPLPNLPRSMYSPPTWIKLTVEKAVQSQRALWAMFERFA
jgi:hypothetical protein